MAPSFDPDVVGETEGLPVVGGETEGGESQVSGHRGNRGCLPEAASNALHCTHE